MQIAFRVSIVLLRHAGRFGNYTLNFPMPGIITNINAILRSLPYREGDYCLDTVFP